MTDLFLANGVLVLDKVTPVITSFFAPFNLARFMPFTLDLPYSPPNGEALIEVRSTIGGLTWADVYQSLPPLLRSLSIDTRRLSEDDLPAALKLLAAHFHVHTDPTLVEIFRSCCFEGGVDFATMFRVVRRLNDGHGLRAIKLNVARCGGYREPLDLGGTSLFISDELCLASSFDDTLTLGEELAADIQFDEFGLAANRIARYAQSLLDCVPNLGTRRSLHWRVADLLSVTYQDATRRS